MNRFLYGDQGSEHLIYSDGAKAAATVTRYYHETTSLVVGFDRPAQDRDVYYCTWIYNSRGGGFTSGCEEAPTDTMPVEQLAVLPFHTIEEFEDSSRFPSHIFGGTDIIRPTLVQAQVVLQRLTDALARGGDRKVILTLGDWNGSEEGFLRTALAHLRGLLCVLPHRLQRYVTFAINTAPAGSRVSSHEPLLCFQRTGHAEAVDLMNVEDASYCTPWITKMAKDAAAGSGCSIPDAVEAAIRLPYMAGRPLPIALYAQLDALCGLMDAYRPDAEALKAAWMTLRDEEDLDKEAFLKGAAVCYPSNVTAMLAEIEAAIQAEREQSERIAAALREDKAAARARIEALRVEIKNAEEDIVDMLKAVTAGQQKNESLDTQLLLATRTVETMHEEWEQLDIEIADMQNKIQEIEAERDAQEAAVAERTRKMGEGFIWDDKKPYPSAKRYVGFLSDHLEQELKAAPSARSILPRMSTSYPSNAYPKGNRTLSIRPLRQDELEVTCIHKRFTIEERIHHGTIALFKYFRDELNEAQKYKTIQYCYIRPQYDRFNISTSEIVFPMLAMVHLYHEKSLPTPMQDKLDRQSGTDMQEFMLYHALIMFCMMMGKGDTAIGVKLKDLMKSSGIIELLEAIVSLFPDREDALQLLASEMDMMKFDERTIKIIRKEMRG